jgi:prefoldin subunit 5
MQLAELKRQVEHVKQDRERQVEAISRELDQARERIMNLQRSESLVEVYKKKVENFEDLRQQLIDM